MSTLGSTSCQIVNKKANAVFTDGKCGWTLQEAHIEIISLLILNLPAAICFIQQSIYHLDAICHLQTNDFVLTCH